MIVQELTRLASTTFAQGTLDDRQQLAVNLDEVQHGLAPEDAALRTFLGCLAAALRGETPDATTLEEPFTQLWQQFREAGTEHPGQQEGGANDEEG